jgi:5-oxoprolinase (ATP-hydrolysing)
MLRIGNQARPRLFDLDVKLPSLLHERVAEIGGRVGVDGTELEPLDEAAARIALRAGHADGIRAVAIVLMHAWAHAAHEERLGAIAAEEGFTQVSLSHRASPLPRIVPRGDTRWWTPTCRPSCAATSGRWRRTRRRTASLLHAVERRTDRGVQLRGQGRHPVRPAGGIVGAARTAAMAGFSKIIGFDMGGTSTDVALYDGQFERAFETMVAGVRMRAPMMAINTVAAGGGSILHFDGARTRVGPDSAGAVPGPACYRRGGP